MNNSKADLNKLFKDYSTKFNSKLPETAIILAAGHGKRIKSSTSKMLHKIWGVTTVERVYNACKKGLGKVNSIVVVGIKADKVTKSIGKKDNTSFAYQEVQNGTGHATQIALQNLSTKNYNGTIYVLPGDMGLIDDESVIMFKKEFKKSKADMMVLTGIYDGNPLENSYGRIIRVKKFDVNGTSSGKDYRKVIEIKENKDIHALKENEEYVLTFNKRKYSYTKKELIENNEYNSGVFAFNSKKLIEYINKIKSNNAQKEIYLTDMIAIFNEAGLSVGAVSAKHEHVIMGFNDKAVLNQMNAIARDLVYNKIKTIVDIEDPKDFYIDDNVVDSWLKRDKKGEILDIKIGKGVYIRGNVKLSSKVNIGKNSILNGDIKVGNNVKLFNNCIVEGKVNLGSNIILDSHSRIFGEYDSSSSIGDNVALIGNVSIRNSKIDKNVNIENSVIADKKIVNNSKNKEETIAIRNYLPNAVGEEFISDLK